MLANLVIVYRVVNAIIGIKLVALLLSLGYLFLLYHIIMSPLLDTLFGAVLVLGPILLAILSLFI